MPFFLLHTRIFLCELNHKRDFREQWDMSTGNKLCYGQDMFKSMVFLKENNQHYIRQKRILVNNHTTYSEKKIAGLGRIVRALRTST